MINQVYLKGTWNRGTLYQPYPSKRLEVYMDNKCARYWNTEESEDRDTASSRHGYIITYAEGTIAWKSQLQAEVALSSTESEYTGLSNVLRETIPSVELLKEINRLKVIKVKALEHQVVSLLIICEGQPNINSSHLHYRTMCLLSDQASQ